MIKQDSLQFRWSSIRNIMLVPAIGGSTPTAPTERRNWAMRATLQRRIRREFEEMPGMSLTPAQATALFGISLEAVSRILPGLAESRVLRLRSDGRYVLRADQT